MTVEPIVSDETGLAKKPQTGLDAPAGAAVQERDDANDYAAYWQARSGFFDRVPEGGQDPDPA